MARRDRGGVGVGPASRELIAIQRADHIGCLSAVLAQLPENERVRAVPRTDTGGASKALLHHVTDSGLEYIMDSAPTGRCKPRSPRSLRPPGSTPSILTVRPGRSAGRRADRLGTDPHHTDSLTDAIRSPTLAIWHESHRPPRTASPQSMDSSPSVTKAARLRTPPKRDCLAPPMRNSYPSLPLDVMSRGVGQAADRR